MVTLTKTVVYRHICILEASLAKHLDKDIKYITKRMAQGGFVINKSEYRKDGGHSIAITFEKEVLTQDVPEMPMQVEKLLTAEVK